jgi:hypothetical protein
MKKPFRRDKNRWGDDITMNLKGNILANGHDLSGSKEVFSCVMFGEFVYQALNQAPESCRADLE